jgi:hypothetical protein
VTLQQICVGGGTDPGVHCEDAGVVPLLAGDEGDLQQYYSKIHALDKSSGKGVLNTMMQHAHTITSAKVCMACLHHWPTSTYASTACMYAKQRIFNTHTLGR